VSLKGLRVLITNGPTREPIDPVRFISNGSTGAMGRALARAALRRGAKVTVVSGPVCVEPPKGAAVVPVTTALEMRRETLKRLSACDVLIAAAAVSDWRVASPSKKKRPKKEAGASIRLLPNPDIVAEAARRRRGRRPVIAGFALESHDWIAHAEAKLARKGLDLIVANRVPSMGGSRTRFAVLDRDGMRRRFPTMTKDRAAAAILDIIGERCATN
jgi:phosphopantothenoylcysteine decarboxylase/phosphopantothenate--cysteine ligase